MVVGAAIHVKATGRQRHRVVARLFGREKLVLQVEERGLVTSCIGGVVECDWCTWWRDARATDLALEGVKP